MKTLQVIGFFLFTNSIVVATDTLESGRTPSAHMYGRKMKMTCKA